MAEEGIVRRSVSSADIQINPLYKYVLGDIRPLTEWLQNKPFIVRFIVGCLRGLGQPIFLNNPISGTVILAALFVQNQWQAINGILGLLTAMFTALALGLDKSGIENGSVGFNGLLTGLHIPLFSINEDWNGYLVFPVILYAAFSTLLNSALGNLCGQWTIPAFNLPFNIAVLLFVAGTGPTNIHFPTSVAQSTDEIEVWGTRAVDWLEVLQGILRGVGQCYGCDNVITGSLITLATLICSPILFLHAIVGSFIGILTGMAFAAPPSQIYAGGWGPNSLLVCMSIGGFFYVFTWQSHLLALFGAISGSLVAAGLGRALGDIGLPALAFSFCFVASMCLLVTSESKGLRRVPLNEVSYPEEHRRKMKPSSIGAQGVIT